MEIAGGLSEQRAIESRLRSDGSWEVPHVAFDSAPSLTRRACIERWMRANPQSNTGLGASPPGPCALRHLGRKPLCSTSGAFKPHWHTDMQGERYGCRPIGGLLLARNWRPAEVALTSTPAPEVASGTMKPRSTASSQTASLGHVVRQASITCE
jgi:hypothetical protein